MVVYGGPGVLSTNEEYAHKKNLAEDVRLGETIESLSIDERSVSENFKKDIKELRRSLKDIKKSSGRSPEGIRTLSSRARSGATHCSSVSYQIPNLISSRINSSKSDFIRRDTAFSEIDKILRGEAGYLGTGECVIKPRAHTGDGGQIKPMRKFSENDPRKTKSEGNSGVNLERMLSLCDDDSVFVDSNSFIIEEKDNDIDAMTKYFQKIYNPWNIRNRDGRVYDALQLPHIKDCHRPVCRPTCNTCALRKKKGPCFLIPGLVHVEEEEEVENTEEELVPKPKKRRKKKSANEKLHDVMSFNENELKLKSKKGISASRLQELAVPKEGYRRELRFSKAFLKRSLDKMTEMNEHHQMSVYEKDNQMRIQSKVSTFLAFLNQQNQDRQPKKMVDLPLRDDLIRREETNLGINLPIIDEVQSKTKKPRRKVVFK